MNLVAIFFREKYGFSVRKSDIGDEMSMNSFSILRELLDRIFSPCK
jgi:hypothetical protein